MVARGLGRGYRGLFAPSPPCPSPECRARGVEGMLWAGTHPGRHKLEEARNVPQDPGPSPPSAPARSPAELPPSARSVRAAQG